MTHHHQRHNHSHSEEGGLPFDEKMIKLLEHWIQHNKDHMESYMDWAAKAREKNFPKAASLIEEAADMTDLISEKFKKAAQIARDG